MVPVDQTSGAIEELAHAVRTERRKRNLSTYVLADLAGVNRQTITRLENGAPVNMHSALCVMAALEISVSVHGQHAHDFEEVCKVCGQKRGAC